VVSHLANTAFATPGDLAAEEQREKPSASPTEGADESDRRESADAARWQQSPWMVFGWSTDANQGEYASLAL
jgi:hypothetical protein